MLGQYATNYVFINLYVEGQGNLIGDPLVTEVWISALRLDDS